MMSNVLFSYNYLYAMAAALSCIFLILWFFFKDNKSLSGSIRSLFFLSLIGYGVSIYMIEADLAKKMVVLTRDFFILSGLGFVFGKLASNKIVFLALLVLLMGGLRYGGLQTLRGSFSLVPQKTIISSSPKVQSDAPEFLVELQPNIPKSDLAKSFKDGTIRPAFDIASPELTDLDDYVLLDADDDISLQNVEYYLDKLDNIVESTESNDYLAIDPMESKPVKRKRVNLQEFGLNDPALSQLWGFQEMKVDQLYKYIKGHKVTPKKKARIYILDTGVDAKHEDIAANYKSLNKKHDTDTHSHGTHCAGIAAAVSNNKKGIASMTQNNKFVEVTSIKVLGNSGGGMESTIIQGMITAADNGADVISMSLGGLSNDKKQKAFQKAVEYANKKGAIVIVAAGNSNDDSKKYAPANCPGTITVSAVNEHLDRAKFSNYINNVDYGIAAPGVNIYSCIPNNKYASFNGTSMATPYVAGLVGIMKSIQPDLTTKEAHFILEHTGIHTSDTKATGKFIQPAKAVQAVWQSKN